MRSQANRCGNVLATLNTKQNLNSNRINNIISSSMSSAFSAQSIANQAELAMTAEIRQPRAKEYLLLPEGVRQLDASEKPFFQQLYFKTTHYSSEIDETGELWC
jgi:hypothetical protein